MPLHCMAAAGHVEAAQLFVAHGAAIHAETAAVGHPPPALPPAAPPRLAYATLIILMVIWKLRIDKAHIR